MEAFSGDAFNVPDSTDWLGTPLACLMQLEQAFRCHVCKDFYNSPMITSCNHTFCSICIRRCLSVDGKCPLCRASDQESKLRGNWALREAVDAFVQSRDVVLQFAKTPIESATSRSPKRKATDLDEPREEQLDNKRLRMTTRSSKAKAVEATAAIAREEVDVAESEDTADYEPEPDDGLVACPICWARMKPWQVDRHLDTNCPGSPQPKAASSSTVTSRGGSSFGTARTLFQNPPTTMKPPERLPALAYSMLKDTALRKKMAELGLSTQGSRQMLEKRHQEWVTIWNANCDSARPKKRSELLHDLEVWERTVGTRAPTMSRSANLGAQIKDKDFDGAAWAAKHDTSFKDLIAKARSSKHKFHQKGDEVSKSEEASPAPDLRRCDGDPMGLPSPVPEPPKPKATVVDLTELSPSSQPEPLDSPTETGQEIKQRRHQENGAPYLFQVESIANHSLSGEAEGTRS